MRKKVGKPTKLRYKVIKEPVFFCVVHVFLGGTYEEYRKKLEKLKIKHPDTVREAFNGGNDVLISGETGLSDQTDRFIWIKDQKDLSTIHHECIHLALQIMESKGVPTNKLNEEVIAYYSEFWFNTIKSL